MSYKTDQIKRATKLREDGFFGDKAGKGHILSMQESTLLDKEALKYFEENKIRWWGRGKKKTPGKPTGILTSSQVACINHLFPLREKKGLVTELLKARDKRVKEAVELTEDKNAGFVAFEVIRPEYLNEGKKESAIRGQLVTSIDALMVGKKDDGKNILFVFEWKYAEIAEKSKIFYEENEKRRSRYGDLLKNQAAIKADDINKLFCEPFCQLMRQTLFALEMLKAREYNCDEYIHLHVIPEGNDCWNDVCKDWKNLLIEPKRYLKISPEELFKPIEQEKDISELIAYLKKRYW